MFNDGKSLLVHVTLTITVKYLFPLYLDCVNELLVTDLTISVAIKLVVDSS